jgi:2,3-bisphosphoglycerate-independent phosphoglycerate mutase
VPEGSTAPRIADGDSIVFMNFRADRAREITRALTDPHFDGFPRGRIPRLSTFVCLTSYGDELKALPVAFPPQSVANGFGSVVASRGLTQLRIAETEKYAHVTYFFSGGVETPLRRRGPVLVQSPKSPPTICSRR